MNKPERARYQQSYFRLKSQVKPTKLLHLGNWEFKLYVYFSDMAENNEPACDGWYWKPYNLNEVLGISRATYYKALSQLTEMGLIETENVAILGNHNGIPTFFVGSCDGNTQIPEGYKTKKSKGLESIVRDRLQQQIGGESEVVTPIGRIDLLTVDELIEVKFAPDWKEAMGQVLAYGAFFPSHQKRLHLFHPKNNNLSCLTEAQRICSELDILVTTEETADA
jgi:hypothetical protein